MAEERDLALEFLEHLSQTKSGLGEGEIISKKEIAEIAVDWVLDQKLEHKLIGELVEFASEFLSNHSVFVTAANRLNKDAKPNKRVQLDVLDGLRDGTILSVTATKSGDRQMWILWDAPVDGEWITLQHLGDIALSSNTASRSDQVIANDIRSMFSRLGMSNADLYSKLAGELLAKRPTILLKHALLSLVAKGDARFNAEAWIEVWITDSDLEMELAINEIRKSEIPFDEKIKAAKGYARDLATKMLSDLSKGGIKVNWQGINLDESMDRIDWEKLVSAEGHNSEASLKKSAQATLETLQNTTEEQWLQELQDRDAEVPFDTKTLRERWYTITQNAIEDMMKISPYITYLEDYNRMKRAFDSFAESKGLPKWNSGTLTDEWQTP